MCGIAGVLLSKPSQSPESLRRHLKPMIRALQHRGPDHEGIWTSVGVGLASARLSIMDTSDAGNQPMSDSDGRVCVIFNGEIYNHVELRRDLEAAGHQFTSHTDTEVLVQGYLRWGIGIVKRLQGMFAFALWDDDQKRLILARDAVGKKPLYYAFHKGDFIFGSEAKAVLAWPGIERKPNYEAIHHYLTFQYTPGPLSAFDGLKRVPPGQMMIIDRGKTPRFLSYSNWRTSDDELDAFDAASAQEELRFLLEDSVRRRMRADVSYGALLSGGVDSAAIVALMARNQAKPVKTFTIGFEDAAQDERSAARETSNHFGTEHQEFVVRPNVVDLLPRIVWHYGEPFADPSAMPSFCLAELARQNVKVVLNGDGGDEAFLGYTRYQECRNMDGARHIPAPMRRLASIMADRLPTGADGVYLLRLLGRLCHRIDARESQRYAPWIAYFQDSNKRHGYGDALRPHQQPSSLDRLDQYFDNAPTMVAGAADADFHTYLPDGLMVKLDIASMAYGLEARSPLLDERLLNWARAIPDIHRFPPGQPKGLFKTAMASLLPASTLNRPKSGFGVPLKSWLKDDLLNFSRDLLYSDEFRGRGLICPGFINKLFAEHQSERYFHHPRIWSLVMLELWFRMWVDPPADAEIGKP